MQLLQHNVFPILLSLGILLLVITIHELGHFTMALLCGIRVKSFQIGLPLPYPVFRFSRRNNTRRIDISFKLAKKSIEKFGVKWGIAPLLVMGYVDIDEDHLNRASALKKVTVLLGGVSFNIVFGAFCYGLSGLLSTGSLSQALSNFGYGIVVSYIFSFAAWFIPLALPYVGYLLFMGQMGVSGPVAIVGGLSKNLSESLTLTTFLNQVAIISVAVAVTNASFLPVVDGGKIWLLIFDKVFGHGNRVWSTVKTSLVVLTTLLLVSLLIADVIKGIWR